MSGPQNPVKTRGRLAHAGIVPTSTPYRQEEPRRVTGVDDFVPAGGTEIAHEWLTRLRHEDDALWFTLDENLRLCLAQGWLMATGRDEPRKRDKRAAALVSGIHKRFPAMLHDLVEHWQRVYEDLDYTPAIVDVTDLVAPDMEMVMFTRQEFVGPYSAGDLIPTHSFITHYVDGVWKIAATSRRLPVPGWPPAESEVAGLLGG